MAKGRRRASSPSADTGVMGNLSKSVFLEAHDRVVEKLRLKKEADSALSNSYKQAERDGVSIKDLKDAIKRGGLTAEERSISDRRRAQYEAWLGRSVGYQAEIEIPSEPAANGHADPAETEAVQKHENNEAYEWGISAGKAGAALESMPYTPGTEEYQQAASGWAVGQKQAVEALGGATHHGEGRA